MTATTHSPLLSEAGQAVERHWRELAGRRRLYTIGGIVFMVLAMSGSLWFANESNAGKFFDRLFYHQLHMDHGEAWNWEAKPGRLANEVTQMLLPDCPYVFVHDDPTRNFKIQDCLLPRGLKIVRASDCYGDTIFDYIPLMEQAESCHFRDSSVALLWDRCAGKKRGTGGGEDKG